MTGQPDIAAALAWSGEAARAAANAQAALRGEPVPALLISSEAHLADAEASPANPYGSSKHGRFDAASEPALCQATSAKMLDKGQLICDRAAGHGGWHKAPDGTEWRERPDAASAAGVAQGMEPRPCPECGSLLAYSHCEGCSWWQQPAQRQTAGPRDGAR